MKQSSKPVVCQVLHSLHVGGAELLARDFARQSQEDVTTVFACLDEVGSLGEELRSEGYTVQLIGRRDGFDYQASRRLARLWRSSRVSVVHAHQYAPFFYSALGRLPGGRPSIIFTEHGRAFPDFRRPKRIAANHLLLRRCDRVIAVGDHVRQALIENEGIAADRVDVIYNGIDVGKYQASQTIRATSRRSLGLSEQEVVVLQVARLNPLKDHATALRAMARLRSSHPHVRLFIVGDGEERPAIQQLISQLELANTVHLLGVRSDVDQLLPAADIFLLSSVSEGIPLTIIEAMATGLPCVATNVGGVAEVIVAGKTGLLATAGDDAVIAGHLASLADSSELRHQYGVAGRQRAHDLFDARQMHARYQQLYRELAQVTQRNR